LAETIMQIMKVFKFGGASIENAERMQQMAKIIAANQNTPLILVVSALGKTTNALEQVVAAFYKKDNAMAIELFALIEAQHNAIAQELMGKDAQNCINALQQIYAELDWILQDNPVRSYDYYYDQIVCLGEMLSTTIVSHYLQFIKIDNIWKDIRDIILTNDNWREAMIDWEQTSNKILATIPTALEKHKIIITQGFIGSTFENESTTLGREGSDYTAAVFANILNASSLSIWKDVKGLLSGDPKIFNDVKPIPVISYTEVIEMSYYGAQVIHPKTIKPLQNKQIPLYVKCFMDMDVEGTTIINDAINIVYPPILVLKRNQLLLQVSSKDFSFITDDKLSEIYTIFHNLHTHINLIQNSAISFFACLDNDTTKIESVITALETLYTITLIQDMQLLTIRHYDEDTIEKYTSNKNIYLTQKTNQTVQFVLSEGSIHL
jgi:aspartate kinase